MVQSATTQVAITPSMNPANFGAPLTLTAIVTSNGVVATGIIDFTQAGVIIGSAVLNSNGIATLTISSLSPGLHSIIANYAGDSRVSSAVSTPLALVVQQVTSLALVSNAKPTLTITPVTLTATITTNVTQATGTVSFNDGALQLGTAMIDSTGHASLIVPSLAAGSHNIVAIYGGDNNNLSSTSAALVEVVQLRPTSTVLNSSATNTNSPQQVTLIAVVHGTGSTPPSGTVTFSNGAVTIGSSSLDSTGSATINTDIDPNVIDMIVATYNGDLSYSPSHSVSLTVTGAPTPQFTILIDPATVTIVSKQHILVDVTMTSVGGFSDTLELGCLGLPYAATCTFSNLNVTVNPKTTANVQLTVDTGNPLGAGSVAYAETARSLRPNSCFALGFIFAGLAIFSRRRFSLHNLVLMLCAFALSLSITGCAGLSMNGTAPGTYTFQVTGFGKSTGLTENQTMTLIVR